MLTDANGMEILGRGECLDLLRTQPVARLGLSIHALPVIVPVNFAVLEEEIVICTAAGSKLAAACHRAVVALEVDDYDAMNHTGWSVLVQGGSRVIDDATEVHGARDLALRPWANESADRWIAVSTDLISGRRIRHDRAAGRGAHAPGPI